MTRPLRVAFAGTPEFAATALQALIDAGHTMCLVLSQPDRPSGRGLKLQASAVKQVALQHQLPVAQPTSLRLDGRYPDEAAQAREALLAAQPDVLVVVAYGLLLPQWVLDLPPLGCLNIHASLLPRWRGAAPIHRAIEAGDTETGVCIMQMDAGLDTGAVRHRVTETIRPDDTTARLHDRLAALGAQAVLHTLSNWEACPPQAQATEGVTYAHKIDKAEALLDWQRPALALACQVRAFDPFPGSQTEWLGERHKIWAAQPLSEAPAGALNPALPGTVVAMGPHGVDVACGTGWLRVTELQRPGGRRLPVAEFLKGSALAVGVTAAPLPDPA